MEKAKAVPNMISDGKRVRVVWRPGDGDGDPSAHLVERSMNLVRGHPTWKIFVDDIPLPIVRGSADEPPRYVYLDDRACYTIWISKAYTNQEMRDFWAFDFNHQGYIKLGRMNRGSPAYLDDSKSEYAQGRLRKKGMWYIFSGAPEVTEYQPERPKKQSQMEKAVAKEYADAIERGIDPKSVFKSYEEEPENTGESMTPMSTSRPDNSKLTPRKLAPTKFTSMETALQAINSPSRPSGLISTSAPGPVAHPLRTVFGTSYSDTPPIKPHRGSPAKPGSLGAFNPKSVMAKSRSESPLKRKVANSIDDGSPKKRVQTASPAAHDDSSSGLDGTHGQVKDGAEG